MSDAEYMKGYRAANPAYTKKIYAQNKARGKADRALRDRYRVEWNILYKAYLSEEEAK